MKFSVHRNDLFEIKVEAHTVEDLWYLSRFIDEGDLAEGVTFRRVKALDKTRADSGEKIKVHVQIQVSNVEFAENSNKLRVTGKILHGSPAEFIQIGEHQTLDVEPYEHIKIYKKKLREDQKSLLEEAKEQSKQVKAIMCLLDEQQATLCRLSPLGLKFFAEVENQANKRDLPNFSKRQQEYYEEIVTIIEHEETNHVIIAGPGFTKDNFKKYLDNKKPQIAKKAMYDSASNAEKSGAYELLKSGVLEKLLGEQKLQQEYKALEWLKMSTAKEDGLSTYGYAEVKKAVESGAVDELYVSDEIVRKKEEVQDLLEEAKKTGSKILMFNSQDSAGKEFNAFKLAAKLRYKMNY